MKTLSVGVIVTDGKYILGCKPFGKRNVLDIPKGGHEEGEEYIDTAIRELYEETGISLPKEELTDLGKFKYLDNKDLYLFEWTVIDLPDIKTLKCTSYFEYYGKNVPEIIGYEYVSIDNLNKFYPALHPILKQIF